MPYYYLVLAYFFQVPADLGIELYLIGDQAEKRLGMSENAEKSPFKRRKRNYVPEPWCLGDKGENSYMEAKNLLSFHERCVMRGIDLA